MEQQAQTQVKLADIVTNLLRERGHPAPEAWQRGLHPDAFTVEDQDIQRFLINRQLRLLVGPMPMDTTNIRYCLVDGGKIEEWVELFTDVVLPFMVEHSLPKTAKELAPTKLMTTENANPTEEDITPIKEQ